MNDEELVAASLGGDKRAFGVLMERHWARVVALAQRLLADRGEAEDIAQEAFLTAYLDLRRLQHPARFGGWVCGIALNLARMRRRQRGYLWTSLDDLAGGLVVPNEPGWQADEPTVDQVLEAVELVHLLQTALALIPQAQRAVVLMHYVEGLSCQEIAALLGEAVVTVRVRLHRARERLRAELERQSGSPLPMGEGLGVRVLAPTRLTSRRFSNLREVGAVKNGRDRLLEAAPSADLPHRKGTPMLEVTLEDVVVLVRTDTPEGEPLQLVNPMRIARLREKGGHRVLPIWMGVFEGDSLALHLAGQSVPRPMTYTLLARLLDVAGATVERVAIAALREETYYATVYVTVGGTTHEVDARPSDALNLALRVGAPVYVAEAVIDQAQQARRETEPPTDEATPPAEWRSLTSLPLFKA